MPFVVNYCIRNGSSAWGIFVDGKLRGVSLFMSPDHRKGEFVVIFLLSIRSFDIYQISIYLYLFLYYTLSIYQHF